MSSWNVNIAPWNKNIIQDKYLRYQHSLNISDEFLSDNINTNLYELKRMGVTDIMLFDEFSENFKEWDDVEYSLHLLGQSTELMIYLDTIPENYNVDIEANKLNIMYDYRINASYIVERFCTLKYNI